MVNAGAAALSFAGICTLFSLVVFVLAYRQARHASRQDKIYMQIGMTIALPIIFLFWAVIGIMSIWFTVNIMGVQ